MEGVCNMSNEYIIKSFSLITVILLCMFLVGCANANSRDIATSEPLDKSEIIKLSIDSKCLDKKVSYIVYLPKSYGATVTDLNIPEVTAKVL